MSTRNEEIMIRLRCRMGRLWLLMERRAVPDAYGSVSHWDGKERYVEMVPE